MLDRLFYSSVILNSTETVASSTSSPQSFYSSVILNSTETLHERANRAGVFYSSVILNSTETGARKGSGGVSFTVVLY